VAEGSDGLRLIVLKNAERAPVESRDQMVLVVDHRCVHHNLFDFLLEDEDAAITRRLPLILNWLSLSCLSLVCLRWSGLRLRRLGLIFLALLLRILRLRARSGSLRRLLLCGP